MIDRRNPLLSQPADTASPAAPRNNRLLDLLKPAVRAAVYANGEIVRVKPRAVLQEAGEKIRHVYFPFDCVLRFAACGAGGASIDIGVAGVESMAGAALLLDAMHSPHATLVQEPGLALRIRAAAFGALAAAHPALDLMCRDALHAILLQSARMAACNALHTIDRRVPRFFLMLHDRACGETFCATHEAVAEALGVQRVGVTRVASALKRGGIVDYEFGRVSVLNRRALEREACGCHVDGGDARPDGASLAPHREANRGEL